MARGLTKGMVLVLVVVAIGLILWLSDISTVPTVQIGQGEWQIEVADEEEEHRQGLSGRQQLPVNQGMLFIFPRSGSYGFWMKNMKFPLDLIWINGNQVVGATQNIPPPKFTSYEDVNLPFYYPPQAADKALEINAGQVEKFGIKAGDSVVLKLK